MDYYQKNFQPAQLKFQRHTGTFTGYACIFNGTDSEGDTILPGAFADTIKTHTGSIKMFYNHSHWDIPIGKWLRLHEDQAGLYVKGQLTVGNPYVDSLHAAMRHGTVDGLSIGFRLSKKDFTEKKSGGRIIKRISELIEISLVTFPADAAARVDVASIKSSMAPANLPQGEHIFLPPEGKTMAVATLPASAEPDSNHKMSDPAPTQAGWASTAHELTERVINLEQKAAYRPEPSTNKATSWGQQFIQHQSWTKAAQQERSKVCVEVKNAVLDNPSDRTLTQATRIVNILAPAERRLSIRDLLAYGTTNSSSIEFVRENKFTNNAAAQDGQGAPMAESGLSFELSTVPVTTIAHWLPASKQVLEDSPMLASYIDSRMTYGLLLEEENQLLNGTGRNNSIKGLISQQTAYTRGGSSKVDVIRRAMLQVQLSDYAATGVILNPIDWEEMELSKASDGRYILVSNLAEGAAERIWRLPVVVTNSMPAGHFQVGAYQQAAQFWDRHQTLIEVSREDRDNFTKNMATILASERIALTVYRPAAIVGGAFPTDGSSNKAAK